MNKISAKTSETLTHGWTSLARRIHAGKATESLTDGLPLKRDY